MNIFVIVCVRGPAKWNFLENVSQLCMTIDTSHSQYANILNCEQPIKSQGSFTKREVNFIDRKGGLESITPSLLIYDPLANLCPLIPPSLATARFLSHAIFSQSEI